MHVPWNSWGTWLCLNFSHLIIIVTCDVFVMTILLAIKFSLPYLTVVLIYQKCHFFCSNYPDDTILSIQLFLLVLFSNYYIRLSVMQRIIQIEEYVIQITCSKICLILHTIWKPNLRTVLSFIQNISSVREKDELQCFLRWHKLKISQQQ